MGARTAGGAKERVLMGGKDLRRYTSLSEPCGLSSVVSPDVFLFRDSVRENIRLG